MIDFIRRVKATVSSKARGSMVKDSFWMLLSQAFSAVIQAAYFIFLARTLGAQNYGSFEGVKAVFHIAFPFIGLGVGDILVQNVSRDASSFARHWGDTLVALMVSLAIALLILFPLTTLFLPSIAAPFILLVLFSDLLGLKLWELTSKAFTAVHQMRRVALIKGIYVVGKFLAALALPLFPPESRLLAWGGLYFIGSMGPGLIFYLMVNRAISAPHFNFKSINIAQWKQGFFFSLSSSAEGINAQVDRTMLVAMPQAGPAAAGIYGAGYRFIDMGFLPIFAILSASYGRFFQHGEAGIKGTLGFARKLLPAACIYGCLSAIALVLFSPFVSLVLGEDFAESSAVLIWLAPIHLLAGLQFLAADTLTGAGLQRSRSFVQVGAAMLNISLNFYLIPLFSWKGAIWATLGSEVFKTVALWLVVLFIYRQVAQADELP